VCSKQNSLFSPRGGRSKIAQRFIAGIKQQFSKAVREADGRKNPQKPYHLSPVSRALGSFIDAYPALKCWAIFKRPLRGRYGKRCMTHIDKIKTSSA